MNKNSSKNCTLQSFTFQEAYIVKKGVTDICFSHIRMNFENSFCLIPLSSSNQKYLFLFQRIEWHPNPTDFELCTMKGKSKVSTYFLISIFPHIYNLLDSRQFYYTHARKRIVLHFNCITIELLHMLIVMAIIQSLTKNVLMMG